MDDENNSYVITANKLIYEDTSISMSVLSGESEVVSLIGAAKFSCQSDYTVTALSNRTCDSGATELDIFTFKTKALTGPSDYMVVYDTTGTAWAASADLAGAGTQPTGAVWASIPASNKTIVDLTTATTAAQVASLFRTALAGLSGIPITFTTATSSVRATQNVRGVINAPEVHNRNDTGSGSITVAISIPGVDSEVDVANNSFFIPNHGFPNGVGIRVTGTGTLPAPLVINTTYYVIVVNANIIKVASTVEDAIAITPIPIDITTEGSSGNVTTFSGATLTATITYRKSNDGVNWVEMQTPTTISGSGKEIIEQNESDFKYFSLLKTLTAGVVTLSSRVVVIGDSI